MPFLSSSKSSTCSSTSQQSVKTTLSQKLLRRKLKSHRRFLLLGLDNAGKTSLLNCISKSSASTLPTLESDVKLVKYKKLKLFITDVGGQFTLQKLWRSQYTGIQGIALVIDSVDLDPARVERNYEIYKMITTDECFENVPVLVLANKFDQRNQGQYASISAKELKAHFSSSECLQKVNFCDISATNGTGVFEAFDWLCQNSEPM
eukprot:maker-scaffold_2-snap-gene-0.5-mRNA-1 protein AED:0.00 eAED:0.00 QI:105/1/1/1/1/1/2/419/204